MHNLSSYNLMLPHIESTVHFFSYFPLCAPYLIIWPLMAPDTYDVLHPEEIKIYMETTVMHKLDK